MEMSMKSGKSMSKLLMWEYVLFVTRDEDAPWACVMFLRVGCDRVSYGSDDDKWI